MKPLLALFALLGLLSACDQATPGTYTGAPALEEVGGDSNEVSPGPTDDPIGL